MVNRIKKYNTETFKEISNKVYNSFYDYTKSEYLHSKKKILIICPIHGEFWQNPLVHMKGSGCASCGLIKMSNKKKNKIEDIFKRCRETHGNKYDYSISNYTGMQYKMDIICPIHGVFQQQPADHIRQTGCPLCSNRQRAMSIETFLKRVQKIHKNKYTYPNLNFSTISDQIEVVCVKHGSFYPTISNHLNAKSGCGKCGYEKNSQKLAHTNKIWLEKANIVHGNKYVYLINDLTLKPSCTHKIEIICSHHGIFKQTWSNHVHSKQNCPKCFTGGRYSNEYFTKKENINKKGYLYIFEFKTEEEHFYKLGITNNIKTRKAALSRFYPNTTLYYSEKGFLKDLFIKEQNLLNAFVYKGRYTPKYKIGGDCECFSDKTLPIILENLNLIS